MRLTLSGLLSRYALSFLPWLMILVVYRLRRTANQSRGQARLEGETVPIAGYFFIAGCVLGGVCGFRINVRIMRWMEFRRPSKRPSWDPTHLILGIQLRDTLAWEIAGFVIAITTVAVAIHFLKPA
jgi:hypothetical protein